MHRLTCTGSVPIAQARNTALFLEIGYEAVPVFVSGLTCPADADAQQAHPVARTIHPNHQGVVQRERVAIPVVDQGDIVQAVDTVASKTMICLQCQVMSTQVGPARRLLWHEPVTRLIDEGIHATQVWAVGK